MIKVRMSLPNVMFFLDKVIEYWMERSNKLLDSLLF